MEGNLPFEIPENSRMDYLAPAEIGLIQEVINNYPDMGLGYNDPYRLIYVMAEHINLLQDALNG